MAVGNVKANLGTAQGRDLRKVAAGRCTQVCTLPLPLGAPRSIDL
jgi:hypothetical protein